MIAALLTVIGEEAPSSISGSDQLRAALVLGACLLAVGILAALAVRQARRRNPTRTGQGQRRQDDLKPDENGSPTPRPGG
jgi:hypothetical protein